MFYKRLIVFGVLSLYLAASCEEGPDGSLDPKPEDDGKIVDGKADAWNPTNNPSRFQLQLEYTYDALKTYVEGRAAQTPWPSDYWSYYEDSTNVRYHGPSTLSPVEKYDQAFNGWTPNLDLRPVDLSADCSFDGTVMDTHDAYYAQLGPAATWQHRNKGNYRARNKLDDDSDGKIDECRSEDYDGIETWWGLCHAWVPAAILEPEPTKDVTVNGVSFTVSDIKALLITMYDQTSALMIGGRCNEKDIARDKDSGEILLDECKDTNAGTFHVVVVNMLGIMKRAFAEDRTANYQVWNQPVYRYSISSQTDVTEEQAMQALGQTGKYTDVFDSPNAVKWVRVDMSLYYITESSNTTEGPLVPTIEQYTRSDRYEYILELDSAGKIVGGEWLPAYYDRHPDFLWLPTAQRGGNPRISFAKVKQLLELSNKVDDPAPVGDVKTFENTTAVAIPDNNAVGVTSAIEVTESLPIGSLKVELEIEHTYVGDLLVTLTKGSTTVTLHNRQGGGEDNLNQSFTVKEQDGSDAQGTWTLKVSDLAGQDVGQLVTWKLHVAGSDLPLSDVRTYSSNPAKAIADNSPAGIQDTMALSDQGAVKGLKVTVDITHPYVGDLVVKLVHDGNQQVLQSREGGSADDLKKTFTLTSFNGAPVAGDWTLQISDEAKADQGTLNGWTLELEL